MILKSLALWLAIIPLAIINGLFREKVLIPSFGAVPGRAGSGCLLAGIVVAFTTATIGWIPRTDALGYLGIGIGWAILTVGFEFGFGHFVAKKSWASLTEAYKVKGGELWSLVLLVVAVSPYLAAKIRGFI